MRFPRNAKIFRGQLDMVPLANVLFLLLIFILLASLIYTPGIPIQLSSDQSVGIPGKIISISRKGEISYDGRIYKLDEMEQLRKALKGLSNGEEVALKADPGAPKEIITSVRQALDNGIQLASSEYFSGTDNPILVVAVNWRGQLFYENQLVSKSELKEKLQKALGQSKEPFTLMVSADKSVETTILPDLSELANQLSIKQMILQVQPRLPRATNQSPSVPRP